jgi:glycosyltransferase involved in cell wall biosynthesis
MYVDRTRVRGWRRAQRQASAEASVVTVCSETDRIEVVGEVECIEDELARAHVVVVPLRIGSGTRLKILEGWAHGVPVVSTVLGAEGLPARHEDNILLAESPVEFARACGRALTDDTLRIALAASGRRTVAGRFDTGAVSAALVALVRTELGLDETCRV